VVVLTHCRETVTDSISEFCQPRPGRLLGQRNRKIGRVRDYREAITFFARKTAKRFRVDVSSGGISVSASKSLVYMRAWRAANVANGAKSLEARKERALAKFSTNSDMPCSD